MKATEIVVQRNHILEKYFKKQGGGKFKKTSQRGGGGYPQALIILEALNLDLKANYL